MILLLFLALWESGMGLLPSGFREPALSAPQLTVYIENAQAGDEVAALNGSPSGAPPPADPMRLRVLSESLPEPQLEPAKTAPVNPPEGFPQGPVLLSIETLRQFAMECHLMNDQMAKPPVVQFPPAAPERAKPVYLRDCHEWCKSKCTWAPSTAREYRLTVSRWESYWDERGYPHGPDIRDIKDGDFAAYAKHHNWSGRTSELYWVYFEKLLKSSTIRSPRLKYGRSAADVILVDLPASGLECREQTREVWDESLSTEALDVEAISKLMYASQGVTWPACPSGVAPCLSWNGLLWLEWYCGPRMSDAIEMDIRNFDWNRQTLKYRESKRGKIIIVPIPDVAMPLLRTLKAAAEHAGRTRLFAFPAYCVTSPTTTLYKHMARFHAKAGVEPLKKPCGRIEWFHQFRKSCTSQWIETASGLQRFFVGHKTGDVSDDHYARVLKQMRVEAVKYPVPEWLTAWNKVYGQLASG